MQYKSVKRAIKRGHLEVKVDPIPGNKEYARVTLWRKTGRGGKVFYEDRGIVLNKLNNNK